MILRTRRLYPRWAGHGPGILAAILCISLPAQEDEFDPNRLEFDKLKEKFEAERSLEPFQRVETLGKFGDYPCKDTVPFLQRVLDEEKGSPGLVGVAVAALGKLGSKEAVEAIVKLGVAPLVGDINMIYLEAALRNPLDDDAEEWLLKYGLSETVRRDLPAAKIMLKSIARLRSEKRVILLQAELKRAATPEIKVTILRAFRDIKPKDAARVVHALLRDQSVEVQVAVLEVLEAVRATAYGREYAALLKSPHWQVRSLAVDLIALVSPPDVVLRVTRLLEDPEQRVRVSAVQALVQRGGDDVVEPLIKALDKNQGRVLDDLADGLARLTGKDFGTVSAQWESWWTNNKGRVEIKRKSGAELVKIREAEPPRITAVSTYFGLRVLSKNVAFIFDCSDSMTEAYEPPGKKREPAPAEKPEGKTVARGKAKPAPTPAPAAKKDLVAKLDVAKKELLGVLERLPADVATNVVRFNSIVEMWKPALTVLSPDMRFEVKSFVQTSRPAGLTNLYAALEEAFKDEKLDTIYLLSDGAPTLGVYRETDEILAEVEKMNQVRKVKINTIGFHMKPEEQRLMEDLAERNYGIFISR